ncbi:alkaline phosphatase family protein [Roseateles sp.]|uniref:alkaline phosphatase family protein n=1 Tax=Roseateles sp. TaxID=1971397 RepID=UPI003BAC7E56
MTEPLARKLLLVGWDAADWQMMHPLIDAGRMPHLKRLVEHGTIGNLATLQPMLSPLLWTSIATGKRAYLHGVHGFVEPTPDGTALRPTASTTRQCKALWNILAQSGKRCQALGWFASHPAENINGACVSELFHVAPASATPDDWPPQPNAVFPASLADDLAELRLHPAEVTASMLLQFIPKAAQLDQRDPEVQRLLSTLARRLAECISLHSLTTALMEEQPWEFCTAYYDMIDRVGHDFMAFHPPRMANVRPDLYEPLCGVMNAVYEFHDQMLGRLVELAGPDAHVMIVSDHGFLNGASRPTQTISPEQWHRPFGTLLLAGPGIRKDATLPGATLLDIAPTVLTLFGLPVGRDMEGRVLVNAFEKPPAIERIDSWEAVPDPVYDARVREAAAEDPAAAAASMRQMVELGYIEAPGEDVERDIVRARAAQKFNLACTCLDGRHAGRALALALELAAQFPQEPAYRVFAGQAAIAAGDGAALLGIADDLERLQPGHPQLPMFRAFQHWIAGDAATALRHFEQAARDGHDNAWLQCRIGRACLRLRQWAQAEQAFRRALELDANNAEAHYGLSVALPRQGQVEEGVQSGLRAIAIQHDDPLAHFQLGAVMSRLGWYERALQAFDISLTILPNFAIAHRYVSQICLRLKQYDRSLRHREIARRVLAEGLPQPTLD